MEKRPVAQIAALVVVVGFVCFGGGYMLAGGSERLAEQHAIGENITVNVKAPGQAEYISVDLKSGMTVLDAVANVIQIKTEIYSLGPAIKSVSDQWLLYIVNGESPEVGMDKYQLKGGENIELNLA
ncbi:MAG: hypothetical protein AVW05_01215 [Hadesarchaea archaeon DG-33]|nr:MAG: hypothetical protein AVW05_01215 [Hadesarchaea archaeon DG-33]